MSLNQLFTENHKYLNTVAKRITGVKSVKMAPDLVNETYLVVFEKHEKGLRIPDKSDEFVKWFSKCMKNYFQWPNSSFNRLYNPKETLTLDQGYCAPCNGIEVYSFKDRIEDEDALKEIETLAEDTDDFTRELIHISPSLGKEKTLKYIEVVEFKRTLPTHEVILFELYYEKELSSRKIAALYSSEEHKMNYQSVNQMINKIKVKLNNYTWR